MTVNRLTKRFRAFRRYRSRYLATIDQLSALSNQQLEDVGINRWEIADKAHARARGIGMSAAEAR